MIIIHKKKKIIQNFDFNIFFREIEIKFFKMKLRSNLKRFLKEKKKIEKIWMLS